MIHPTMHRCDTACSHRLCTPFTAEQAAHEEHMRQLEIAAVSKALEFLSSDEAHELFTSTFNPKFVQTRSQADERKRARIVKVLEEAAQGPEGIY